MPIVARQLEVNPRLFHAALDVLASGVKLAKSVGCRGILRCRGLAQILKPIATVQTHPFGKQDFSVDALCRRKILFGGSSIPAVSAVAVTGFCQPPQVYIGRITAE